MGFKVGKTINVSITADQDGNEWELKHVFDARRLDEALLDLPSDIFKSTPDNVIAMKELNKVWNNSILSVDGYDADEGDEPIDCVPLLHKIEAVGAVFNDRFISKKKPTKSNSQRGKR